jgi:hypothetical protein
MATQNEILAAYNAQLQAMGQQTVGMQDLPAWYTPPPEGMTYEEAGIASGILKPIAGPSPYDIGQEELAKKESPYVARADLIEGQPVEWSGSEYVAKVTEESPEVLQAGFGIGSILSWVGSAFSLLTDDPIVATVASGVTAAGQALTEQSEGGTEVTTGLVTNGTVVGGVPFGGPGVPEPPNALVSKMWKTKSFSNTVGEYWVYHWLLIDGRRASYNAAKKQFKVWKPKHNIVLGPKPRVKDLIKINRTVNRLNTRLKKQLRKAKVEL